MAKRNTITGRLEPEFVKEMKELAKMRYFRNLANKEPSIAEMTALLRKTNGWQICKEELKVKPKKVNK